VIRFKSASRGRNQDGRIKRKKWKFTWRQAQRVGCERRVAFICATRNLWGKSQTKRKRTCPRINKTSGVRVCSALLSFRCTSPGKDSGGAFLWGRKALSRRERDRLSRPDAQQPATRTLCCGYIIPQPLNLNDLEAHQAGIPPERRYLLAALAAHIYWIIRVDANQYNPIRRLDTYLKRVQPNFRHWLRRNGS
jgi:hypothetical protein